MTAFRQNNTTTPTVLMGYYNPIHHDGVDAFTLATAIAYLAEGVIVGTHLMEQLASAASPA